MNEFPPSQAPRFQFAETLEVPAALPEAQPVGVVHAVLGRREMVQRPIRIGGEALPRLAEPPQRIVPFQRRDLLLQRLRIRLPQKMF